MLKTEQYYELDQDIIDYFKELERDYAFALDIDYIFQANTKQKQLITIKKISDNLAVLLKAELIVTVNEHYFNVMDDSIRKVLFEQELDKIVPNLEKGTIKLVQPTLKTSAGIVKKFTYESVERANETQRLLAENKMDE
jgi:pyruvate/2-oxoglutarate/acetoin dehydrogenase E1 component